MGALIPIGIAAGTTLLSGLMGRSNQKRQEKIQKQKDDAAYGQAITERQYRIDAEKKRRNVLLSLAEQYGVRDKLPQAAWDRYLNYDEAPLSGPTQTSSSAPSWGNMLSGAAISGAGAYSDWAAGNRQTKAQDASYKRVEDILKQRSQNAPDPIQEFYQSIYPNNGKR